MEKVERWGRNEMILQTDLSKKESIREAAKALFLRFGFSKTSMDDIARQSNLAKPSLYYYYPNKEAIFNEVVIEEARQFMDYVEGLVPAELPAHEKMAFFYRTLYQELKLYAEEISNIPEIMYQQYPHGQPIVEKIMEFMKEKLHPILVSGEKAGVLQFHDVETTLDALVHMTDFLNLKWMHRTPEKVRDNIVNTVIELIINGMKRRDG